jgi:ribonuclease P/MRP protein subunit POP1
LAMAPDPSSFSTKRKSVADSSFTARKRAKTNDARTLAVQSSDGALSKTGELDVSAFVAAREFEIRALEAGIRNSKSALASRAFQKVPRNLRRRTASHNVKRVPRRLKARARREVWAFLFPDFSFYLTEDIGSLVEEYDLIATFCNYT